LSLWKILIAHPPYIVAKIIHLNSDYRISGQLNSPGLYPTPYFHFRFPATRRQTCTAWAYGKYLIARPTYNVAKSTDAIFPLPIPSNSTPNVHSLSLWKILIAHPPYIVAKSIHLNSDYRISVQGNSPGLYPTPYFHFRTPVASRQTCTAWVYGKYLIARPPYIRSSSVYSR